MKLAARLVRVWRIALRDGESQRLLKLRLMEFNQGNLRCNVRPVKLRGQKSTRHLIP